MALLVGAVPESMREDDSAALHSVPGLCTATTLAIPVTARCESYAVRSFLVPYFVAVAVAVAAAEFVGIVVAMVHSLWLTLPLWVFVMIFGP